MSRLRDILFIISVCGVTILNIFVNGALVIALPTLGEALNFTQAELQWPLNVYALSYGSLLLFFGRLADVTGNKRMFLLGTGFFTVWSIATGLAPNKVSFIVFVALTGVGAAANTPTGIGIFANHFQPGPTKNRAIAALGAGQAVGYIIGLIGGGFLCQGGKLWRVIFYIQAGLAAVFFVLGIITIPSDDSRAKYTKGVDGIGALLSVVGVGVLTYVLSESTVQPKGWETPWIIAVFIVSLLILAAFVFWEIHREKQEKSTIMPMSLWKKPGARLGPTVALVFLAWGSYNSLSYFMTLYFQQIREDDPIHTALETVPFVIMVVIANGVAGALLEIVRGDILIAVGLCGAVAAPLIFALIDVNASYWAMAFIVMLTISWVDVAYTVGNLQISISFDADSQGLAGGIFNVATRLGTSIALAVTSSVSNSVSNNYNKDHPDLAANSKEVLMKGFRAAGWASLALAGAAWVVWAFGICGIGIIGKNVHATDEKPSKQGNILEDVELRIAEVVAMQDPNVHLNKITPHGFEKTHQLQTTNLVEEGSGSSSPADNEKFGTHEEVSTKKSTSSTKSVSSAKEVGVSTASSSVDQNEVDEIEKANAEKTLITVTLSERTEASEKEQYPAYA